MALPNIRYPDPPAQLAVFTDVLGSELAIGFLLRFGGATVYLPKTPAGQSEVERYIGRENLRRLSERHGDLYLRVPLGNVWLAAALDAQGKSQSEIARTLRATDVTVRRWLKKHEERLAQGKRT